MSDGYLQLVSGGLSATISQFVEVEGFIRKQIETPGPNRSVSGAMIVYRQAASRPHRWQFNCVVPVATSRILEAIWMRQNSANAAMTLTDTIQTFQEDLPRNRAKAPAPFDAETVFGTSYVSYFAKFSAWFVQKPEVLQRWSHSEFGPADVVNIQIEETGELIAP